MQCSIENNLEITKLGFAIFVLHENLQMSLSHFCFNKINIVGNFNYLD